MSKRVEDSRRVVDDWLSLIDSGRYAESWDTAGAIFQQAIERSDWASTIEQITEQVGEVKSREWQTSIEVEDVEGFPDGEYVVNDFKTEFATELKERDETTGQGERVTTVVEPDGRVSVVGYYVL